MNLATLDKDLNVPEYRIGDPAEAYGYVYDVTQADMQRALYRTHVQGLIDGNAPNEKSKKDRTNLNFRQATAIVTQFKLPYTDLFCEVPLLYEIETVFGKSEERSDWSQIISEEFHRMLVSWEDWDETMQITVNQMLVHNIGHLYYESAMDWRPQTAQMNEILVKDQSPTRLNKLEAVVIRKGYMTTELMNFIADEKAARALGWNVPAVKKTVRDAYNSGSQPADRNNSWEWFQQKRKNSDLYFGAFECERAWTARIIVPEYDKSISASMIRTDKQINSYLNQRRNAFASMDELINPFFYDIGNGKWHSGRGVGTEIFPYCQIFNKLRCKEVDAAFIAASVLVQARDGAAAKSAQMLTLDNLKIIPDGLEFKEHAIGQNIQATLDVRRDMEQGMNQNIGALMKAPGAANPRKGQKQAIMEMQQAAQLGKGKVNQFYSYMDRLGRTMFKKASNPALRPHHAGAKEALEFQRRCIARGVPVQALQEIDFVKAYRSAGAGSSVNAIMALEAIKDLAPSFNEPGRIAYMRLLISRMLGTRTADMIIGEIKTKEKETDDGWQAEIENVELRKGANGSKFFQERQDHSIHAKSHIEDAEDDLKQLEAIAAQRELQIEDLQPVHVHLESAMPHTFEHLKRLKGDSMRKGDYTELNKRWLQIAHMADQLGHNLEQMQEERQRAQQEQAQQQPQPNAEMLKNLNYDKSPESVKVQMETIAGVPRQPGDASVQAENTALKRENMQLKAEKQKRDAVVKDIETSQSVEKHRAEMSTP